MEHQGEGAQREHEGTRRGNQAEGVKLEHQGEGAQREHEETRRGNQAEGVKLEYRGEGAQREHEGTRRWNQAEGVKVQYWVEGWNQVRGQGGAKERKGEVWADQWRKAKVDEMEAKWTRVGVMWGYWIKGIKLKHQANGEPRSKGVRRRGYQIKVCEGMHQIIEGAREVRVIGPAGGAEVRGYTGGAEGVRRELRPMGSGQIVISRNTTLMLKPSLVFLKPCVEIGILNMEEMKQGEEPVVLGCM